MHAGFFTSSTASVFRELTRHGPLPESDDFLILDKKLTLDVDRLEHPLFPPSPTG
jgi:hypothetical protein